MGLHQRATLRALITFQNLQSVQKVKAPRLFFQSFSSYTTPENTALSKQNELKRYGVPKLEETLPKYLQSIVPFVNENEYNVTKNLANELVKEGGLGKKLQSLLEQRAKEKENWLADWWLDRAYLGYRGPVMVWSSPGAAFPKQTFNTEAEQLDYAARLVAGFIDFKFILDKQCLPVDHMGKDPLDMQQIYTQFGVCRIPGEVRDTLSIKSNSKHIVVAHNNEFFKLPVITSQGLPLSEEEIYGSLKYIVEKSQLLGPNPDPVGIMTAMSRDDWFKVHQELLAFPDNANTLNTIQSALMIVCLDGDTSQIHPNDDGARTMAQSIHGHGSRHFSGNRWFDTTLQVFIGRSGENGMTIEHSGAEALAPITIANHALSCVNGGNKFQIENCRKVEELPEHLPFLLTDTTRIQIKKTSEEVDKLVDDLDLAFLNFTAFGKSFIKTQRFSPDSFVQMALQYAFYRIHKTPGAHYESGSLRVYKHGRTDIIRSCSIESIAFAKAMMDNSVNEDGKVKALVTAIKAHNDYAKKACFGQGVDRHLLGLQLIAKEHGLDIPNFFKDKAYTASTTHRISTSQVSGAHPALVSFGPLVMDGYGCCYNIRDRNLMFGISAMKSCPETGADTFKEALKESLEEMHDLTLQANQNAKL